MARHGIPDLGDKAKDANSRFLSRLPSNASESFEYFYEIMTGLKENVSEEEFRRLLSAYLGRLVEWVEAGH